MARPYYIGHIGLERFEEGRCVDRGIDNGTPRWVGRRLYIREEKPKRGRWLLREYGEESEELRRGMIRKIGEYEAFCVVLVYPGSC